MILFQLFLAQRGGQKPADQKRVGEAVVSAQFRRIAGRRRQDAASQGAGKSGWWIRGGACFTLQGDPSGR